MSWGVYNRQESGDLCGHSCVCLSSLNPSSIRVLRVSLLESPSILPLRILLVSCDLCIVIPKLVKVFSSASHCYFSDQIADKALLPTVLPRSRWFSLEVPPLADVQPWIVAIRRGRPGQRCMMNKTYKNTYGRRSLCHCHRASAATVEPERSKEPDHLLWLQI